MKTVQHKESGLSQGFNGNDPDKHCVATVERNASAREAGVVNKVHRKQGNSWSTRKVCESSIVVAKPSPKNQQVLSNFSGKTGTVPLKEHARHVSNIHNTTLPRRLV